MRRSRVLVFVATIAAGGAAGLAYRALSGKGKRPAVAQEDGTPGAAKDDEVAGDVASLKAQMRSLRAQIQASRAQGNASPAPGSPESKLTREELRAKQEQTRREVMAGLESKFQAEATDPSWGPTTVTAIQTTLKDEDVEIGEARSVDCRSHTCRVELHDDGTGKVDQGLPALAHKLGGTVQRMFVNRVDDPAGGKKVILYFGREEDTPSTASAEPREPTR